MSREVRVAVVEMGIGRPNRRAVARTPPRAAVGEGGHAMVRAVGIEPTTYGLKVRCSA